MARQTRLKRLELWLRLPFFTRGSCCQRSGSKNACFGAARSEKVKSLIHIGLKSSANVTNETCAPGSAAMLSAICCLPQAYCCSLLWPHEGRRWAWTGELRTVRKGKSHQEYVIICEFGKLGQHRADGGFQGAQRCLHGDPKLIVFGGSCLRHVKPSTYGQRWNRWRQIRRDRLPLVYLREDSTQDEFTLQCTLQDIFAFPAKPPPRPRHNAI